MLETFKNNPKLLILAIIVALCTVITSVPGSIDFIPSEVWQKTIKGVSGLITMVSALLGFKINPEKANLDKS